MDGRPDRVLIIDKNRHLQAVDTLGEVHTLTSPEFLATGVEVPRLAAVQDAVLYVTPVAGGIGRYDLATHKWSAIPLPDGVAAAAELHANKAGLWLTDKTKDAPRQLFLNPAQNGGQLAGWKPPVAAEVVRVHFGEDDAVVLCRDGRVLDVTPGGREEFVGAAFDVPLASAGVCAAEFGGDLFLAVGDRVGRYDLGTHGWAETSPAEGIKVAQLAATQRFLYALTAGGGLYRWQAGTPDAWQELKPSFVTPDVVKAAHIPEPPTGFAITRIFPLGNELELVVAGAGVYRLRDADPAAPEWIQGRSQGLPREANITCAAEIGDELYLGTEQHGVWAYQHLGVTPRLWCSVGVDNFQGPIRKLVSVPGSSSALGVLTDQEARVLKRGADGSWAVAQQQLASWRPVDFTASAGKFYLLEEDANKQRFLSEFNLDGSASKTLIGSGVAHRGAATRSVALDPSSGRLFRADADGKVSAYASESHSWQTADVDGVGKGPRDLFVAAGTLWAWAPDRQRLYQRQDQKWEALADADGKPLDLTQVAWDEKGLLLRHVSGQIDWLDDAKTVRTVLSNKACGFGGGWRQVKCLAELGDWLLAVVEGQGVFAYHVLRHEWRDLNKASKPAGVLVAAQPPAPGSKTFCYLSENGGVTRISLDKDELQVEPLKLPEGETASQLTSHGNQILLLTTKGSVYEVQNGGIGPNPLRTHTPLDEPQVPSIDAACEWQGRLLLAYTTAGTPAVHRVASYDPTRSEWTGTAVAAGPVIRFRQIGPSGKRRLLAEVRLAAAPGQPARALVDLSAPATATAWECVRLKGDFYDLADDGENLWAVDPEGRIQQFDPAAGAFQKTALSQDDAVSFPLNKIHASGEEIIAFSPAGTLWHYGLSSLRWRQELPAQKLVTPFFVEDRLVCVLDDQGQLYRYDVAKGAGQWTAVAAQPGGFADLKPTAGATSPEALWSFVPGEQTKVPTFQFRSTSKDKPSAIGFSDGRFDFNRYQRIAVRNGELWVETWATLDGNSIVRRYPIQEGVLQNAEISADKRFQSDSNRNQQMLQPTSPQDVNGNVWRVTGAAGSCQIFFKFGGKEVPVRPVAAQGKVALDIDVWSQILATDGGLVAAAESGLVRCGPPQAEGGTWDRQSFHTGRATRLAVDTGRIYAELPSGIVASDDRGQTWIQVADAAAAKAVLDRAGSKAQSKDQLTAWRLVPHNGDYQLQRNLNGSFVPVTLESPCFGFDQPVGLELNPEQIRLYTVDGRVVYPRTANDCRTITSLEGTYALPPNVTGPLRPLRLANLKAPVLVKDDDQNSEVHVYDGKEWNSLDDQGRGAVLARERAILWSGGGWDWRSDETVQMSLPSGITRVPAAQPKADLESDAQPPHKPSSSDALQGRFERFVSFSSVAADPAPLAAIVPGRFNSNTGQFSFDTVLGIQTSGDDLWAATEAGIQTWRKAKLQAVELDQEPAFAKSKAARFLRSGDGNWHVILNGQPSVFSYDKVWQKAAAPNLVVHADGYFLSGQTWNLPKLRWEKAVADGSRGGAQVRFAPNDSFVAIGLDKDGLWDFEDVLGLCQLGPDLVLGSRAGLRRLATGPAAVPPPCCMATRPVKRLTADGELVHVQYEDGDEELLSFTGKPASKPTRALADKDRILLDGDTWSCGRTANNALIFRLKLSGGHSLATFGFEKGRFDFDRVDDVGREAGGVVLATDLGFFERQASDGGVLTPVAGLPARTPEAKSRLFAFWQGGRRLFLEHPTGTVYELGRSVEKAAKSAAAKLFGRILEAKAGQDVLQRDSDVLAASGRWTVVHTQAGDLRDKARKIIQGVVRIGAEPAVVFIVEPRGPALGLKGGGPKGAPPDLGGFSFDYFHKVLVTGATKDTPSRLLLGSEGGLWYGDASGRLQRLDGHLGDKSPLPIAVKGLWEISQRVLARGERNGEDRYFIESAQGWDALAPTDARDRIRRAELLIDDDKQGWRIERKDQTEPSGSAPAAKSAAGNGNCDFRLFWQDEPVSLLPETPLRFAHDFVLSVAWDKQTLWLGTKGGAVQFQWTEAGLLAAPGKHLWVGPFLAANRAAADNLNLFSIRTGVVEKQEWLICRTMSGTRESRFAFDAHDRVWRPFATSGSAAAGASGDEISVLLDTPGVWTWRLSGPEKVDVALDPAVFLLPAAPTAYSLFHDGTFSFWNIDLAQDGEPLAFCGCQDSPSWFVATAGGVLRVSVKDGRLVRIYARTQDGKPLTGVSHVRFDRHNARWIASSGTLSAIYWYDTKTDAWVTGSGDFPPEDTSVNTKWLLWKEERRAEASVTLPTSLNEASQAWWKTRLVSGLHVKLRNDVRDAPADEPWFDEGRFRFDDVHQFCWAGSWWLVSDAGILALSDDGTVSRTQQFRPEHIELVKSVGGVPCLLVLYPNESAAVWQWDKKQGWRCSGSDSELNPERLRETARNHWFVCRRESDSRQIMKFLKGDPLELTIAGNSLAPLMRQGIFAFDEVRDADFLGDELLTVTRLGLWHYNLANPHSARIPVNGFLNALGSSNPPVTPRQDLSGFQRRARPSAAPLVVSAGMQEFAYSDDGQWRLQPLSSRSDRILKHDGDSWHLYSRGDPAQLSLVHESCRGKSPNRSWRATESLAWSGRLYDVVDTDSSLWLVLNSGLLWVRKSTF